MLPRRHLPLAFVGSLAFALVGGCVRTYTLFPGEDGAVADGPIADGSRIDALADSFAPPISWGSHTASLGLPDCPAGAELLVNDTSADLDGGDTLDDPANAGPTLSLVEAFFIAANRPGQDNILFDANVFAADAPATITIPAGLYFPNNNSDVCIDGRSRGVVIRWQDGSSNNTIMLGLHARMMGLTLLAIPFEIGVGNAQLAACRINTDGNGLVVAPNARPWAIGVTANGVVGPHNVIAGDNFGVRTEGAGTVRGNSFGYDPLTRKRVGLANGIDLRFDALIEANVFAVDNKSIDPWPLGTPDILTAIRDNLFGVTRDGTPLANVSSGLALVNCRGTIGPGNVIRGADAAISLGRNTAFRITQNVISGNGAGIVFTESAPTAPPTLTSASPAEVQGTCPVAGTVEVFSDVSDQGESFLGEATCTAGGTFNVTPTVPIAAGRFVTATLTSDAERLTSAFSAPLAVR